MPYRCNKCGRFTKRIIEPIGLPLLTGFPPDKPFTASTVPFAPFVCYNHGNPGIGKLGSVEYQLVGFSLY